MLYEAFHVENHRIASGETVAKTRERKRLTKNNSAVNVTKLPKNRQEFPRSGSFAAGHKLRESKWFLHEETKILCAVLETGFVVEKKTDDEQKKCFGVAVWTPGYEKSKDPDHVKIYTLKEHKENFRVQPLTLLEFWPEGTSIRINNNSDKTDAPLAEDVIRNQIKLAESGKRKWHNTEHFTYWCRYGPIEARAKRATDSIKGINFGFHAGFAIVRKLRRSQK